MKQVTMISCGVAMIYSMFSSKETIATRLTMTMADLATNVAKIEVPEGQRYLMFEVCSNDEEGEEVDAPSVRLRVN
ncbi:hypothetical protein T484DRAFT_1842444 [Baffinella frigidus]|nr:hypothetical protein T484DRAFT_1842444 [Cryptophyta sp. CCMP2293]